MCVMIQADIFALVTHVVDKESQIVRISAHGVLVRRPDKGLKELLAPTIQRQLTKNRKGRPVHCIRWLARLLVSVSL